MGWAITLLVLRNTPAILVYSDYEKGSQSGDEHIIPVLSPTYDDVDRRKLLSKIDWHVLPYTSVIVMLAFLDRVNISNAVLYGLQKDLKLVGTQYNTALLIFFIPYLVFEIPSNIFLRRLRPHVWLSACMFGFGLVTLLQGFTQNYAGILTTRFFLGFFEAGMFPGCYYLLAMWYRREESQKRFAYLVSASTLAGAFGGLLASAIGKMDGLAGYRGWRWIFILEGILTCVVALIWFFLLPDFPEDSRFFSIEERAAIQERLSSDVGSSGHNVKFTLQDYLSCFKDYKMYLAALMYCGLVVPIYCYSYFVPTIIKSMGYGVIQSQLRSVPPNVVAFVVTILVSYASDYSKHRAAYAIVPALASSIGFAVLLANPASVNVKYGAIFITSLAPASIAIIVGWCSTNFAGHLRRSTGSAFQVMMGNIGGIIATYAFPTTDAPRYVMGYCLCIAFIALSAAASLAYLVGITIENRRREKGLTTGTIEGLSPEQLDKLGDRHPDYRYLQ